MKRLLKKKRLSAALKGRWGLLAVPGVAQCVVYSHRLPQGPYNKADEDRVQTGHWKLWEVK